MRISYGRQHIFQKDFKSVNKALNKNFLTQGKSVELFEKKISFIGIIGERELENKELVLRTLGTKDQETIELYEFIKKIKNSCRIE